MKVAILAGGAGLRFAPETHGCAKALADIGDRPILWHLFKYFSTYGHTEFVVGLGHHGHLIRDYFSTAAFEEAMIVTMPDGTTVSSNQNGSTPWQIELIDTGLETETAGRLKRLQPSLGERTFLMTWCDGLADIDIDALAKFHVKHGRLATLTAIHPPPRFGRLRLDGTRVDQFDEKAPLLSEWINGAFFVFEPGIFEMIDGDGESLESVTLPKLAAADQLRAFRHENFWQCMDTALERDFLLKLWQLGAAPWKIWA